MVTTAFLLLIPLLAYIPHVETWSLFGGTSGAAPEPQCTESPDWTDPPNWCCEDYYVRKKYKTSCFLGSCDAWKNVKGGRDKCCEGYISTPKSGCRTALCKGKSVYSCTVQMTGSNAKAIATSYTKSSEAYYSESGGECHRPDKCINCNRGFTWHTDRCKLCPQISKCINEYCEYDNSGGSYSKKYCEKCEGHYGPTCQESEEAERGKCAYVLNSDRTSCTEACSWRSTSTICWPGKCGTNQHKTNCECKEGFSGSDCTTIDDPGKWLHNLLTLKTGDDSNVEAPYNYTTNRYDGNQATDDWTKWTNRDDVETITVDWRMEYPVGTSVTWPTTIVGGTEMYPAYLKKWSVGIIGANFDVVLKKSGSPITIMSSEWCLTASGETRPPSFDNQKPRPQLSECLETRNLRVYGNKFKGQLTTMDVLTVTIRHKNGGYIDIDSFEDPLTQDWSTTYSGKVAERTFTYTFDFIKPYHCSSTTPTNALHTCITNFNPYRKMQDHLKAYEQGNGCFFTADSCGHMLSMIGEGNVKPDTVFHPTLTIPDLTDNPTINISLTGWLDDHAKFEYHVVEVFEVKAFGNVLKSFNRINPPGALQGTRYNTTAVFTLPTIGVYELIVSLYDYAGNYELIRRYIFYDDSTNVTIRETCSHTSYPFLCKFWFPSATENTSYVWQINLQDQSPSSGPDVYVQYIDRYINQDHYANKWLEEIVDHNVTSSIKSRYDDWNDGLRNKYYINHTNGVTRFLWAWRRDHQGGDSINNTVIPLNNFTDVDDIYEMGQTLHVPREDGDTIYFWIKVMDLFGHNLIEKVGPLHFDSTPAIIQNLWLERDGRTNLSVHRIEEFFNMTVEWETYDIHSGIWSVKWELYDNYSNFDFWHGRQQMGSQGGGDQYSGGGGFHTIADCEAEFTNRHYGHDCYCTPMHGCFHQDFRLQPKASSDPSGNGLFMDKTMGVHDHDYFIKITVINGAQLISFLEKRITIDISPPHQGHVIDGSVGDVDIDYTTSTSLSWYWEGFFDKESGIYFYQWAWGTSCKDPGLFHLNAGSESGVVEQVTTTATATAPGDGVYYVSVVAYNSAMERSDVLCSDGITIDNTAPTFSEVAISNVFIRETGVIKSGSDVYFIRSDRYIFPIDSPSGGCVSKAYADPDFHLYPHWKWDNGTYKERGNDTFCSSTPAYPASRNMYLYKDLYIEASWKSADAESGVKEYEAGVKATASGVATLLKNKEGTPHFKSYHSSMSSGATVFLEVSAYNGAGVKSSVTIGPFTVEVTPPQVDSSKTAPALAVSGDYLVGTWAADRFTEPQTSHTNSVYEFAIGSDASEPSHIDVHPWSPLASGATCSDASSNTCTAIKMSDLQWRVHGRHTYVLYVRVTNEAGLHTTDKSAALIHDWTVPNVGTVKDYPVSGQPDPKPIDNVHYGIHEDVDYQVVDNQLCGAWYGFKHVDLAVTYEIAIGTSSGGTQTVNWKASTATTPATEHDPHIHCETGLSLSQFSTYYFSVKATNSKGSVTGSSDGVKVLAHNAALSGVNVYDGPSCNPPGTPPDKTATVTINHQGDMRIACAQDIEYQQSQTTFDVHWSIPNALKPYINNIYWKIEEADDPQNSSPSWHTFRDFVHIGRAWFSRATELALIPGKTYRSVVRFCHDRVCFQPLQTTGVLVLASEPITGDMFVDYIDPKSVQVSYTSFYDPDITDFTFAKSLVDRFDYAITANGEGQKVVTKWTRVGSISEYNNTFSRFTVTLAHPLSFTECTTISIRGYSKISLYSTMTREIKDCTAFNPLLIIPHMVIDAYGDQLYDDDGNAVPDKGQDISLVKNELWLYEDRDFTPYKNVLSAVWPTLRHHNYTWGVIRGDSLDAMTHYQRPDTGLQIQSPCTHPSVIKCGQTTVEYVNVPFADGELQQGMRYYICIHAPIKAIHYEKWIDYWPEAYNCSDGITVDITPPTVGAVYFGYHKGLKFATSLTELFVNWDDFVDVEEHSRSPTHSGIKYYEYAIGTTSGGADVIYWTNVGVTNHARAIGIRLQNGHTYFASVRATDFLNKTSSATSQPLIIDTTPPVKHDVKIEIVGGRYHRSTTGLSASWVGVFSDDESGVAYYEWAIGNLPGHADVYDFVRVESDEATASGLTLTEGVSYYVTVKAFNGAGLSSIATSWSAIVETSPPHAGLVYDGWEPTKDVDYQTITDALWVHWMGFYDSHSPIEGYYWWLGSCPGCDDILTRQGVGTHTNVTVTDLHLRSGFLYYATVRCCNMAGYCTEVTSDGIMVDDSPPVAGRVNDGYEYDDITYQNSRRTIAAKWFGFNDPHSGVSYYEWRAGTTKGGSNVMATTKVDGRGNFAFTHNLPSDMPTNQWIYITVRAYNKLHQWAESTSNGFMVDVSAPVFDQAVGFYNPYVSKEVATMTTAGGVGLWPFRSFLYVKWQVSDAQSKIEDQYAYLIPDHFTKDISDASFKMPGSARDFIFPNLEMHDGTTWKVKIISCNFAKLCTTSLSAAILIDNTGPIPGTFAIETIHAADLTRFRDGWMRWTSSSLKLAWLGFHDTHTPVQRYRVYVGSAYKNQQLASVYVDHTEDSSLLHGERVLEGYIQQATIPITGSLSANDVIFVSLIAYNQIGMPSPDVHHSFRLVSGGLMELVRRCPPLFCGGDCVCAPQYRRCQKFLNMTCQAASTDGSYDSVTVKDTLDFLRDRSYDSIQDIDYTPVRCMIAAQWKITPGSSIHIRRFEVSAGYAADAIPRGIFNAETEVVWHDVGLQTSYLFLLKRGNDMAQDMKYKVFVRAWYTDRHYKDFESDGFYVDARKPTVSLQHGGSVRDVKTTNSYVDVDYSHDTTMYINFANRFYESNSGLARFDYCLGTIPGMDDTVTRRTATTDKGHAVSASYSSGQKYYATVFAYNHANMWASTVSDGFIFDDIIPRTGFVADGIGLHDQEYSNSSKVVGGQWHGFFDLESFVEHYEWCVGTSSSASECSLVPWTNVGLHTEYSKTISSTMSTGSKFFNKVKAVDAAGLVSNIGVSDGVTVDTTPPVPKSKFIEGANMITNPSFETNVPAHSFDILNVSLNSVHAQSTVPQGWTVGSGSRATSVKRVELVKGQSLAQDGLAFGIVYGTIKQQLTGLVVGDKYRVTFFASHLIPSHAPLLSQEGHIKIAKTRHVFKFYSRPQRWDNTNQTNMINLHWQEHIYYFTALSTSDWLEISTYHHKINGMALDNVKVQRLSLGDRPPSTSVHPWSSLSQPIHLHTVILHEWNSVAAAWDFVDPESPIVDYLWAIGTVPGGTQLQGFRSVGRENWGVNGNLTLAHGSHVHVTVVATNAAGLRTTVNSDAFLVDRTVPVFTSLIDGPEEEDRWIQMDANISASWNVSDPDSGIDFCEYCLGVQPGSGNVKVFSRLDHDVYNFTVEVSPDSVRGQTVYTTVRCHNYAGFSTTSISDGVTIVMDPPDSSNAYVIPIGETQTRYKTRAGFHSKEKSLLIKWGGFVDPVGIDFYELKISGLGVWRPQWMKVAPHAELFANVSNSNLKHGRKFKVEVRCTNMMGWTSDSVSADIQVDTEQPVLLYPIYPTLPPRPTTTVGSTSEQPTTTLPTTPVPATMAPCNLSVINETSYQVPLNGAQVINVGTFEENGTQKNCSLGVQDVMPDFNATTPSTTPMSTTPAPIFFYLNETWIEQGRLFKIKWPGLFQHYYPLSFEVSVGNRIGGGDVLQWAETTDTEIVVDRTQGLEQDKTLYYVTITAISPGGWFKSSTFVVDVAKMDREFVGTTPGTK